MSKVITCESGGNRLAINRNDPYGGSKGIAQFLQPTFDHYSKLAGIKNGDIWNVDDQLNTMGYMFSKSQEHQWSCARKLGL